MTWTGQSFTAGQVLTASQLNALQADITAQANGDSGAPKNQLASMDSNSVDTSQLVASAVTQGKLSTTTSEVSTTSSGNLTLGGGSYGFYPQVRVSVGTTFLEAKFGYNLTDTAYATIIYLSRLTGSGTCYAQQRYVQASPPYDLGDGTIPLFVFLLIDNGTAEIVATYIAPEAPWHYNGPTFVRADEYIDGIPHQLVRSVPRGMEMATNMAALVRAKLQAGESISDAEREQMRNFHMAMEGRPLELREITQQMKNADMHLLPHPFLSAQPGQTVVMVDPVSPILERLLAYVEDAGSNFETTEMFRKNFFTIGNAPIQRNAPPGVMPVSLAWRNTP